MTTLTVRLELPDGHGVVLGAVCTLCAAPVDNGAMCKICDRVFCAEPCYGVHLVARDSADPFPVPAPAPAPDPVTCPHCRRHVATLVALPCDACGWSRPLCSNCDRQPTASGRSFAEHALSLHRTVCSQRRDSR